MTQDLILQTHFPPGLIDLGIGTPDVGLIPFRLLHKAAEKFFSARDPNTLQ